MSIHGNHANNFASDINRNIAQRPILKKKKTKKAVKAMITTFFIFSIIIALFIFGIICFNKFLSQPNFIIKKVCVLNTRTISPVSIVKIAKIRTNMNIYATSLIPIKKRLERCPDIKTVKISKKHPDMLIIKVIEREPIAVIVSNGKHYDIPIDSDGVMLSEKKMEFALHLPKIIGLRNIAYRPGKKIMNPKLITALKYLDALKRIKRNVFINVKKIDLENPNDIVLKSGSIEQIYLNPIYSTEIVLKLVRVIDELRFQRINAKKIDLRFNDVAVTPILL